MRHIPPALSPERSEYIFFYHFVLKCLGGILLILPPPLHLYATTFGHFLGGFLHRYLPREACVTDMFAQRLRTRDEQKIIKNFFERSALEIASNLKEKSGFFCFSNV